MENIHAVPEIMSDHQAELYSDLIAKYVEFLDDAGLDIRDAPLSLPFSLIDNMDEPLAVREALKKQVSKTFTDDVLRYREDVEKAER
ncbi:MAG: hypothetical protein NUV82_01590 [Candidatus Komeilibacteria bacterium]|nr:hypothetical protein [Candidatus Komeilibacteria bacterium]